MYYTVWRNEVKLRLFLKSDFLLILLTDIVVPLHKLDVSPRLRACRRDFRGDMSNSCKETIIFYYENVYNVLFAM